MTVDRRMLETPTVRRFKTELVRLADEYLLHDGWGHLEVDMRILTRHQKEIVIKAGREYRFVVDLKNQPAAETSGNRSSKTEVP